MRRVNVNGNLTLMDYCTAGPQYASGGFIADSKTGTVINGSQQQFLVATAASAAGRTASGTRSSPASAGRAGRSTSAEQPAVHHPAHHPGRAGRSRTCTSTPPGKYNVFVPGAAAELVRHHLGERADPGHVDPAVAFYLAKPSDSVATINAAARARARTCSSPRASTTSTSRITSSAPDTVVLGLGIATLTAVERRRRR